MTNYEEITRMTVEELAAFLCNLMCADCCKERCPARTYCRKGHTGTKDWLTADVDAEPWTEAVAELR